MSCILHYVSRKQSSADVYGWYNAQEMCSGTKTEACCAAYSPVWLTMVVVESFSSLSRNIYSIVSVGRRPVNSRDVHRHQYHDRRHQQRQDETRHHRITTSTCSRLRHLLSLARPALSHASPAVRQHCSRLSRLIAFTDFPLFISSCRISLSSWSTLSEKRWLAMTAAVTYCAAVRLF